MASAVSVPVSDRTLGVLMDHLRDLDLPTILARMADRSEPYLNVYILVLLLVWYCFFVMFRPFYDLKEQLESKLQVVDAFIYIACFVTLQLRVFRLLMLTFLSHSSKIHVVWPRKPKH